MRPAHLILPLVGACALAGCGATSRQEVEAKVQQFARATEAKDYATLCSQVLAPSLVAHLTAAGLTCHQAMKIFVSSVQNPTISVARVTITGPTATAVVIAQATGQPSSREQIDLDTSQGWRLASLAAPR